MGSFVKVNVMLFTRASFMYQTGKIFEDFKKI